jgi:hypothetical protein
MLEGSAIGAVQLEPYAESANKSTGPAGSRTLPSSRPWTTLYSPASTGSSTHVVVTMPQSSVQDLVPVALSTTLSLSILISLPARLTSQRAEISRSHDDERQPGNSTRTLTPPDAVELRQTVPTSVKTERSVPEQPTMANSTQRMQRNMPRL